MAKCPSCGAELPSTAHFGMKASPKNYLTPPITLRPGKKYLRRFSLLYYPRRADPEYGELPSCVVIASEEYPRDVEKSYPFIAGAKFYVDELDLLQRAGEDVFLTELAFRAFEAGVDHVQLLHSRLRSLYHSPDMRASLFHRLEHIVENMRICRDVTAKEGEA